MNVRVLMTVLTASTALAVAGCGGSSTPASPPASPAQSSSGGGAAAAASSSAQQASGPAKTINVCTALPPSEASTITGTTLTTAKPNSVAGQVFGCDYDGPNSALLQISVDIKVGKLGMQGDLDALKAVDTGHPPTMISGVGDAAFSMPNPKGSVMALGASSFASYGAVFGSTYIKIGGLTYVNAAQGKQIVELLNSKL